MDTNINLPNSIDNAIKNLTDKPTADIGQTLSDIWSLVFGPINLLAEKRRLKYASALETFKSELEQSVSEIPREQLIEPPLQVTAQALENAKYCVDEPELRQMFVSLISSSMNLGRLKNIHPSFADMIKQMSPLDALVIKAFKHEPSYPICDYRLERKPSGYRILTEHVFLAISQENISLYSQSLTSLERFGLISMPQGVFAIGDENNDPYKIFENHPLFKKLQDIHLTEKVYVYKGIASLTSLGRSFVTTCVPD